jgi:hypothetical protein
MSVVEALVHYMEIQGYKKADLLDSSGYFDLVFARNELFHESITSFDLEIYKLIKYCVVLTKRRVLTV